MKYGTFTAALAAAVFAAGTALSASVTDHFYATSAIGSNADHSLWISGGLGHGIGSDFDFSPKGSFKLFDDGTATLTGDVVSQTKANAGFKLSFNFDDTFLQTPSFKSENDSVQTPDTIFRDLESGLLTGTGILEGLIVSVSRLPVDGKYAAQIGPGTATNNGSNNKNQELGLAVWLKLKVESATCMICANNSKIAGLNGRQGDINVNLTPVPLPASGLLLVGGLAGFAAMRRKSLKS